MGEVRIRPVCIEHGLMRWDDGMWSCHGFSGEGCLTAMLITEEQCAKMTSLPGVAYERSAV